MSTPKNARRSSKRNDPHPESPPPEGKESPVETPSADAFGRSLELLAKVKSGALTGKALAPADRQALVALLAADGLSTPEIAQIIQVTDRTIERDRRAIRDAHAVPKDPRMVEQMVGRLMAEAELAVQRIRRTARDREVEAAVKIDAEHRCFLIVRDLVQGLQRLGYLPTATQKVEADLTHHIGELPTLGDLQIEIDRLKLVGGGDAGAFTEVEEVVARAVVASGVRDIVTTVAAREQGAGEEVASADQA